MNIEDFEITSGLNVHQNGMIERNDKLIDYTSSQKLSFENIISLSRGLVVISEFFDVNAVVTTLGNSICAVALGKTLEEALMHAIDSNPIDFVNSTIVVSAEIDSSIAKLLKKTNIIAAPSFTKNAIEILEAHDICYVTINTPLKDYKKFLSNETIVTPLGTLVQTPNLSELKKDTFAVVSKKKPSVEQIEDAVFAWKVAKHVQSRAIVIAKDLKTSAIAQCMQSGGAEYALNLACESAKEAVLAVDVCLDVHDVNAAIQNRIGLIIAPIASPEVLKIVDKYDISLITTGIVNKSY